MNFKMITIGLVLSLTACTSMNERQTASVNPQVETSGEAVTKENPLNVYYQNIVKKINKQVADRSDRRHRERCEDESTSCMKATCDQGGFTCSSQFQLETVAKLCKGIDGDCVKSVCSQGGFSCSSQFQLESVIKLCKDSRGSCVKAVCKQGGYSCSSQFQLETVIRSCKDVDGRCVEDICAQGGFSCSSQFQLEKVISMCAEH